MNKHSTFFQSRPKKKKQKKNRSENKIRTGVNFCACQVFITRLWIRGSWEGQPAA